MVALLGVMACAGRDSTGAAMLPLGLREQVETRLIARAREVESRPDADVRVELTPNAHAPERALLLHAEIHSNAIDMFELDGRAGEERLRWVRVQARTEPSLTDDAPVATIHEARLSARTVRTALEQLQLLGGARLEIVEPQAEPGTIALRPLVTTSRQHSYFLRLQDAVKQPLERHYAGYGSNTDAPDCVPLELAWKTLLELDAPLRPIPAGPGARQALLDVWPPARWLPDWETPLLLSLAAAVPSSQLLPQLLQALEAHDPDVSTLAANALAATTGRDLRKQPDGAARPLAEVVSAYKELGLK